MKKITAQLSNNNDRILAAFKENCRYRNDLLCD